MKKKDRDAFYVGAALSRDLESDEVDLILQSEGMSVDTHSAVQCKDAINRNIHNWVPGGPVYAWDKIKARIGRQRGN